MTDQHHGEKEHIYNIYPESNFNSFLNDEENQQENNSGSSQHGNEREQVSFIDEMDREMQDDDHYLDHEQGEKPETEEESIRTPNENRVGNKDRINIQEQEEVIFLKKKAEREDIDDMNISNDLIRDEEKNKNSEFENKEETKNKYDHGHSSKPSLCDLIRENINKMYYATFKSKSGNYNKSPYYNDSNKENNTKEGMSGIPFSPIKKDRGRQGGNSNLTNNLILSTNEEKSSNFIKSSALIASQELNRMKYSKYTSKSSGSINFNKQYPTQFENSNKKDEGDLELKSSEVKNGNLHADNKPEESAENSQIFLMSENQNLENSCVNGTNEMNPTNSTFSMHQVQKKMPALLTNLQNMYDLNSERVRKRSEQMKKRKVRLENEGDNMEQETSITVANKNLTMPIYENENSLQSIPTSNNPNYTPNSNRIKLNKLKKYKDEENLIFIEDNASSITNSDNTSNLSSSNNTGGIPPTKIAKENADEESSPIHNENEPEVVVSDLECDLEDIVDKNIMAYTVSGLNANNLLNSANNSLNSSNLIPHNTSSTLAKSFIPLQNHLRSKRAVSVDKATPSYLMALYQYEESDSYNSHNNSINSNNTSNNNSFMEDADANPGSGANAANFACANNNASNKMYRVDEVIEEETSENNTDTEVNSGKNARKRSSKFNNAYGSNNSINNASGQVSSASNLPLSFESPPRKPASISTSLFNGHNSANASNIAVNTVNNSRSNSNSNSISHANTSLNNVITSKKNASNTFSAHSAQENLSHDRVFKKIKIHKNSKSEYIDIRIDMKTILENIQKKKVSQEENRLEKIKLRKSILLNKFFKSHSHHNFPYSMYSISHNSHNSHNSNSSNPITGNASCTNFNNFNTHGSHHANNNFNSHFSNNSHQLSNNSQHTSNNSQNSLSNSLSNSKCKSHTNYKRLSINTPNTIILDNLTCYKRLSPSSMSRAFYYDYEDGETSQTLNKENKPSYNGINFDEQEGDAEDEEEVIQNKSIIEIRDDDLEDDHYEANDINAEDEDDCENNIIDTLENPVRMRELENDTFNKFLFKASPAEKVAFKKSVFASEDMTLDYHPSDKPKDVVVRDPRDIRDTRDTGNVNPQDIEHNSEENCENININNTSGSKEDEANLCSVNKNLMTVFNNIEDNVEDSAKKKTGNLEMIENLEENTPIKEKSLLNYTNKSFVFVAPLSIVKDKETNSFFNTSINNTSSACKNPKPCINTNNCMSNASSVKKSFNKAKTSKTNTVITKETNFEITPTHTPNNSLPSGTFFIPHHQYSHTKTHSHEQLAKHPHIFNNNYINNNINNISISIVSSLGATATGNNTNALNTNNTNNPVTSNNTNTSSTSSSSKPTSKQGNRPKNNSIHNLNYDTKNAYKKHYKTNSSINFTSKEAVNNPSNTANTANVSNSNNSRSNSVTKTLTSKRKQSIPNANTNVSIVSNMASTVNPNPITTVTPKKSKSRFLSATKGDLKHYLTYSGAKPTENCLAANNSCLNNVGSALPMNKNPSGIFNLNINVNTNPNNTNPNTTLNHNSNSLNSTRINIENPGGSGLNNRVNSDGSVNCANYINYINSPSCNFTIMSMTTGNKHIIFEAMKILKFQVSSLDHQRFALEKLSKSKAKFFTILICDKDTSKDIVTGMDVINKSKTTNLFEFKGIYEMNLEKNYLTKIYSVNYYPNVIEFSDVKTFYQFELETQTFRTSSNDIKRLSGELHAFYSQCNYRKFYKDKK